MKRIFLFLCAAMLTAQAWAQITYFTIGNLEYTVTDETKHFVSVGKGSTYPTGELEIPSTVKKGNITYTVTSIGRIGRSAFENCSGLTSITIPNSVKTIGANAFLGCSGLTSVTIPNSVTSIGNSAFCGCIGLTEINVESANTKYTSENGVLFNKNKTTIVCFPAGKAETEYTIPNSVTSIDNSAFRYCSGLTSVTIPNSVTSIGDYAFRGCSSLTSVTIPNSVTSIGSFAFESCSGLTSVTIPNSVTSIGDYAFYNCSGLTSVTIGNSVTSIGIAAFDGCYGLTSVTIPNSVTSIGDYAFSGCSGLTSIAYDGTSEPTIGTNAFSGVNSSVIACVPEDYTSNKFGGFGVYIGHNKVTDQAVSPTCTETGLTEGVHCSNCGRVFVAQEEIPAIGHTAAEAVAENYAAPTCTAAGAVDSVVYCTTCKSELNRKPIVITATGHKEVVDVAVAATCTAAGKTEGKHCSVCNDVLVPQTEIPALGHDFKTYTFDNNATTEADGTETAQCERGCGEKDTRIAEGTKIATTPEKGTAVTESAANAVSIYTRNNEIVVENATAEIRIYDAMGRLIVETPHCDVSTKIRVNTPGVYLVKVGNIAKRVMINY
ncbi:MAG: leucine-rich repeat domain-containing protein [Salinivirgaceae bacterium]|nr:leucine-rich repeat domain-containing protein [Salinivirgaceae bacterium]